MRELLDRLPRLPYPATKGMLLLDTCFLIKEAERHRLKELMPPGECAGECEEEGEERGAGDGERGRRRRVALTSFNAEELVHVAHRLHDKTRESLRHLLQARPALAILELPLHPGDREGEKAFVSSVEPALLAKVPDASDAVLIAAAIATRSDVLTKDKHHLFTVTLENYVQRYGIRVWKEWKESQG